MKEILKYPFQILKRIPWKFPEKSQEEFLKKFQNFFLSLDKFQKEAVDDFPGVLLEGFQKESMEELLRKTLEGFFK